MLLISFYCPVSDVDVDAMTVEVELITHDIFLLTDSRWANKFLQVLYLG